ncbi:MAG: carboxypeptidase-like regulatory domain-containing protein, partial [Muribaculaceae bacterium]|nr:carboxypeptidase-like regulatory domain-containing protein [Muribaculaceae bacterium]
MRYSFLIVIMFLTLLPIRAAEPSEINGTAVDAATGEPVAGVIIKSKGSFTSTGKDGKFRFYLKEGADSVTFRGIGYETLTLPIGAEMARVALNPKSTQLHDVIVEAPDIYAKGDTLVFNVSRYAKPQDNAIIDVIKRLPGIKVEEDGTIEYQGKPINKFYLDGNDFIEGQYGLATNNISHKDVKSVEVMENHQPIKALEGIEFPEEAGINLKLKEDARSRWVGAGKAAAGMEPFLYDASIFTMRIAPKLQNMFTLKSADTGWNPANEITEHNIYPVFSNEYAASLWPEYISADIITTPLSERRTRDNISWLANGISAWKKGDSSMRLKLNYAADKLDYDSSVKTDYYSPEIPRFIQNNSFQTQNHNLSLSLNTETNKRGYYLKDLLNLSADWTDSESVISGSFNLSQDTKRRGLAATNDLKLVKRNEKRLFTLTSRNSISYRPDRLIVNYSNPAFQHLSALDARSTTETEFGRFTRFWKCYATVGVDLNYHRMDLSLSG